MCTYYIHRGLPCGANIQCTVVVDAACYIEYTCGKRLGLVTWLVTPPVRQGSVQCTVVVDAACYKCI